MFSAYSEFGIGGGVDERCPTQGDTCAFLSNIDVEPARAIGRTVQGPYRGGNNLFILSPQNITCKNRCHPPIRAPKGVLTLPLAVGASTAIPKEGAPYVMLLANVGGYRQFARRARTRDSPTTSSWALPCSGSPRVFRTPCAGRVPVARGSPCNDCH